MIEWKIIKEIWMKKKVLLAYEKLMHLPCKLVSGMAIIIVSIIAFITRGDAIKEKKLPNKLTVNSYLSACSYIYLPSSRITVSTWLTQFTFYELMKFAYEFSSAIFWRKHNKIQSKFLASFIINRWHNYREWMTYLRYQTFFAQEIKAIISYFIH